MEKDVIVFDNLLQADSEVAGQTQPVKAIRPGECFHQKNAKGTLYRPTKLEDVSLRAQQAGDRFRTLFQI